VIYTSGSSGRPKGVLVRHRSLVHSTLARLKYYGEPVGKFLLLSSFAFDSFVGVVYATNYGTGPKHKNAFGNCVSKKAKAAAAARVDATINASKACWTERKADPAAFKANWGTNANKSNAFGKCVSTKVKQSHS